LTLTCCIKRVAENLHGRFEQARVAHQLAEDRVAQVQAHGRAHLAADLLADIGGRLLGEDRRQLGAQHRDLLGREQLRQ
jgi:hypothetical protein